LGPWLLLPVNKVKNSVQKLSGCALALKCQCYPTQSFVMLSSPVMLSDSFKNSSKK
jgi:hypothetical protein